VTDQQPVTAPNFWWLSFVDRIDHQVALHLGVTIVLGRDVGDAAEAARIAGCNPGGEVLGVRLRDDFRLHHSLPYCRLITDPGDIAEAQLIMDVS